MKYKVLEVSCLNKELGGLCQFLQIHGCIVSTIKLARLRYVN